MFNIGGGEVIVILMIALIVLGPKRLPDAARTIGKTMSELRRLSTSFQNEVRTALDSADDENQTPSRRNVLAREEPAPAPATSTRPPRTKPLVAAPDPGPDPAPEPAATKPPVAKRAVPKPATAAKAAPNKSTTAKTAKPKNGTAVQKRAAPASPPADTKPS